MSDEVPILHYIDRKFEDHQAWLRAELIPLTESRKDHEGRIRKLERRRIPAQVLVAIITMAGGIVVALITRGA